MLFLDITIYIAIIQENHVKFNLANNETSFILSSNHLQHAN